MDLTVDVISIPVEPEYPIQEIHSTETYFVNKRRVQLLHEVESSKISVEQFLAQIESVRAPDRAGEGTNPQNMDPASQSGDLKESPQEVESTPKLVGGTDKVVASGQPVREVPVLDPIMRPHSDNALTAGIDVFSVYFRQGGYQLDALDREIIEKLPIDQCFRIAGFASPEGSEWFNYDLSVKRAEAVSDYIANKGMTVLAVGGLGEFSAQIWSHPWPMERRVEIYPVTCTTQ